MYSYAQSTGFIPAGVTAGEYLDRAVKNNREKIALIYNDETLTYQEFADKVTNLAASLIKLGIKQGDKVAIIMPNWPEFIIASQAIMKIGAVKVPMHINFRTVEIATTLKHCEAKVVIMASEWQGYSYANTLDSIRHELPTLENVIVIGPTYADMISLRQLLNENSGAQKIIDDYLNENPVEADDLACILYTSGTTGTPKGILHTHNSIYRLAYSSNVRRKVNEQEVWLGMLPLSSAFGIQYIELCPIISNSTLVLMESFDPLKALQLIDRYKVTSPVGVPTMFIRMLKNADFSKFNVSSVRNAYLGGAASPEDMMISIKAKFGCQITITYGASEFGHSTMTELDDSLQIICNTSGSPIYGGAEVKIVGANGRVVERNEIGEIYTRSFGNSLGYYKDPERTESSYAEGGWIHVGDLGVMNEKGYISVVGRSIDMIIRGGHNIYPDEIESILNALPGIELVCIVGYPDPELGERTCAFIKLKPDAAEITRDELVNFLKGKVARYKIPDTVKIVDQFPMTASGKIQKLCFPGVDRRRND